MGIIFERLVEVAVVLVGGMGSGNGLIKGSCGLSKVLEIVPERKAITGAGSDTTSFVLWGRVIVSSDRNLESGNKIFARVSLAGGGAVRSGIVGTDVNGQGKSGGSMRAPSIFSSLVGEEE